MILGNIMEIIFVLRESNRNIKQIKLSYGIIQHIWKQSWILKIIIIYLNTSLVFRISLLGDP